MRRYLIGIVAVFFLVSSLLSIASVVHASTLSESFVPMALATGPIEGVVTNPLPDQTLGELIVRIMRFLLVMVGALSVLFIIIGGVRMVTSGGNEKAVTAGKQTVQWAIIGLITALMSFSIIALVQSVLGRK